MWLIRRKKARWAAVAFCTISWAYAFVARFTPFFTAPRLDKITFLSIAIATAGLLSILIFHRLLPKITSDIHPKSVLKTATLSALIASALLLFIIQPLYFPEHHLLEIMPHPQPGSGNLTINVIYRIEFPGGEQLEIPPSIMELHSSWQVDHDNGPITWTGDPQAKISYARLMQAGIEIIFKTGPQQGSACVLWDGQEQILNLYAPVEGSQSIMLMPTLDWYSAGLTQKVLAGFALAAEFLGLSAIIFISSILPKIFVFRNPKTIVAIAAVLLLLLPLVNTADPPIQFQDARLESSVREILRQPDGVIRQHKLLTIAKLDLTSSEIVSLEGIQYLRNLASFNLRDNHITDITQISHLSRLVDLDLRGNAISDITPLTLLTNLESLNLRDNPITDLSPIVNLTSLRELNLHGITLGENISILRAFPNLSRLNIRNCAVVDISLLAELMTLSILQDDPISGTRAQVDIRDNPIPRQSTDGYASLRPFWEYIYDRTPFVMPVFNTIDTPTFSHNGGFYTEDFWLVLSTQEPQTDIHYSLDGSEPTQDSPLYKQPLRISSRTGQPNEFSVISNTSPIWQEPIGEVFKSTVVRARAFRPDGEHSAAGTHTYFVDQRITERYSLPIMSITSDPYYLFDHDQGIYALGPTYGIQDSNSGTEVANYDQRGGQWERPVHIEFFSASGERSLSQDGGVRIHGSSISKYPQKSLRLIADGWYGQSDFFENKIFPGLYDSVRNDPITNFKTMLLRNSGNNNTSPMFRDTIMYNLLSHTTLDILAHRPAIVFLNGEYWGIYNLRENLDIYYLSAHYQIDPQQVVIMERNSQLNTGDPGDEAHYQALLKYIWDNDINDPDHYNYVATQMDVDNFIDYQIAEIYAANMRWPQDNIKYWRYKTDAYQPGAPNGQDGRWRWLLFDQDVAFGYDLSSIQDDTLLRATGEFLFRSLLENSEFRTHFINQFADHLNTSFSPQRVIDIIDEMQAAIDPEMPEHMQRWHLMEGSMDAWNNNVDLMRTFVSQRPDYVRLHILDYFDLSGTANITLLSDSTKGHILINSIDITLDTPGVVDADEWSGTYFEGIPISLSAVPKPGYQFAGWEGIDQSDPNVKLFLTENLTLTANFIPVDE